MKYLTIATFFCLAAGLGLFPRAATAASVDLIICGNGGDEIYSEKFDDWGKRLQKTIATHRNQSPDKILFLSEMPDGPSTQTKTSELTNIKAALAKIAEEIDSEDDLFIYLIGHGSHWRRVSRFHIPGPDLTAQQLAELLKPIRAKRIIILNTASASAAFINTLSGPRRVICTATKSVEEKNAPVFMEYFIQALEDGSADQNRDERISFLEACRQAADLTEAHYLGEGLMATEHALIDDNGDSLGTRLKAEMDAPPKSRKKAKAAKSSPDGPVADQCFLREFSFPADVPRELIERYLSLLSDVEALKLKKGDLERGAYYMALEILLVQAAKANRQIRNPEKP